MLKNVFFSFRTTLVVKAKKKADGVVVVVVVAVAVVAVVAVAVVAAVVVVVVPAVVVCVAWDRFFVFSAQVSEMVKRHYRAMLVDPKKATFPA